MKAFLSRKNIIISPKRYFIDCMAAMTWGLFSSLVIGLILKVIGEQLGLAALVTIGKLAMAMVGPAIGVAIASALQAPPLVLFSAAICGYLGTEAGGGVVGAYLAALFGTEIGKLTANQTRLEIIITPATTILFGAAAAYGLGPSIGWLMTQLGASIMWATTQQPFLMGILIAVIMGLVLTSPISSSALAIMMDLGGLAAGAATVGCVAQMLGFASISFKDNGWSGSVSQAVGTSMLQMPNIIKNPWILLPPTLAAAILGPLATMVFKMTNIPTGAGMGSAGLVGQITTLESMGFNVSTLFSMLLLHLVLPIALSLLFYWPLAKLGLIKPKDLHLPKIK